MKNDDDNITNIFDGKKTNPGRRNTYANLTKLDYMQRGGWLFSYNFEYFFFSSSCFKNDGLIFCFYSSCYNYLFQPIRYPYLSFVFSSENEKFSYSI
jgi:hypothetical protein